MLLAHGADPNKNTDTNWGYGGDTPLHAAAEEGHADIVELLTTSGADIWLQDREGQTALDVAKRRGNSTIVTLLENALARRAARDMRVLTQPREQGQASLPADFSAASIVASYMHNPSDQGVREAVLTNEEWNRRFRT